MNQKPFPAVPVLIVDDEEDVLQSYKMTLRFSGINNFVLCSDSRQVMNLLSGNTFSAIILDLSMPHISGLELLSPIKEWYPQIPVIVITASNNVATAVDCMKLGALDYMVKPVEDSRLITGLKNAIELGELRAENNALRQKVLTQGLKNADAFSSIITVSDSMHAIFNYIEAVASSTKPVLISGESGVGKELIARAVHQASGRQGKFVPVNVGGLDDTVFSDTLFGHRKGAFTGADVDRRGLIEEATGGTLFLDEIGTLENSSQIKLLRLIENSEYLKLGSDVSKTTNTVIVAATNEDLCRRMKEGKFRNDLYYRLHVHHTLIPPLRDRREDIPVLVDYFLTQACASSGKPKPGIPPLLLDLLSQYDFPGNVRELSAMVFDMAARSSTGMLDLNFAQEYIAAQTGKNIDVTASPGSQFVIPYFGEFPKLRVVEDFLIAKVMEKAEGNQYRAADLLGVAQSTLWRRLKK